MVTLIVSSAYLLVEGIGENNHNGLCVNSNFADFGRLWFLPLAESIAEVRTQWVRFGAVRIVALPSRLPTKMRRVFRRQRMNSMAEAACAARKAPLIDLRSRRGLPWARLWHQNNRAALETKGAAQAIREKSGVWLGEDLRTVDKSKKVEATDRLELRRKIHMVAGGADRLLAFDGIAKYG